MSKHTGFTKLLTAMLLSGLLVIGLAFGNVFAADIQEDFDQTSDIVEEVLAEKPTDALVEDVVKYLEHAGTQ